MYQLPWGASLAVFQMAFSILCVPELLPRVAALLEVSERTVERHWALAKLWLYRALQEG